MRANLALTRWFPWLPRVTPLTLRAGKRMIRQLQQLGPEVDIAAMQQLVMQCFASDDYREGKRAFAEKRSPVFTGK